MVNKWFSTLYNNNTYLYIYRLFTKLDRHWTGSIYPHVDSCPFSIFVRKLRFMSAACDICPSIYVRFDICPQILIFTRNVCLMSVDWCPQVHFFVKDQGDYAKR